MQIFKTTLISTTLFFSGFAVADNQDIVGQWRSIDDKTGFSKGIVEIKKDGKGMYSGNIIEVIPRPGYTAKTHCYKCPAPYTDKPIIGLQVLTNMYPDPKKVGEYQGGTILDPLTGKLYKSRIKLNTTGTRLTMRGFVGVEVIGRSQTWVRIQ